jgi:F420-non-reducing hydrogenase iron-sulfur subunit
VNAEKPRIACFVCNWSLTEEELDLSRMRKPAFNVNVVQLPCLGRLDPVAILELFQKGIDGVLLVGCAVPDCHFTDGNVYAELTVKFLKKLLGMARLEPKRLELRLLSPLEETRLADIVRGFTGKLKKLGSSPLVPTKCDLGILENVVAAKNAMADFYLRALIAKEKELTDCPNVYNEKVSSEEFDAFADRAIETEFLRHRILLVATKKPLSVKEFSNELSLKPSVAFRQVLNLRRRGMIVLDHVEGTTPFYKAMEAQ